ncbi:MAG: hypothetical protein M3Y91_13035 [Actinomycetota bacterium]|nr:hypothetical protein [Actinomycetota bacterium]
MRTAADIILFILGVILVVGAVLSAVRSTILPRATQNRLSRLTILGVRVAFRLRARRSSTYARRDRVMAMLGPVALLVLLFTWLVLIMAGYALMFGAVYHASPSRAVELSGSSVFTLGSTAPGTLGADLLSYSEAGLGLLVVTLLITYLPSIYGAFSRRESGVSLLKVRAGDPPRATTMLIRYHRIEEPGYRLNTLWQNWETWFVDVEETHTTFSVLPFFRSPLPEQSWVTAAGTLLDAASMWVAAIEHPLDPDAQLCIRAGTLALRRIAGLHKIPFEADPAPDDPISVDRSEWEAAFDELVAAGLDVVPDREAAWKAWHGWRVNYDAVLLNLARLVEAPPAPWVSDRSPIGARSSWLQRGSAFTTPASSPSRQANGRRRG